MSYVVCPNCRGVVSFAEQCPHCKMSFETIRPVTAGDLSYTVTSPDVLTSMDPRLQMLVAEANKQVRVLETASTQESEVAVTARVTDVGKFGQLLGSVGGRLGVQIPPIPGDPDQTTLVTARLPIANTEIVRAAVNVVKSIKASRRIRPFLPTILGDVTRGNSSDGALTATAQPGISGEGVILAFVDFGFDITNPRFQKAGGGTRVMSFWDQGAEAIQGAIGTKGPQGYGRVFQRSDIDKALSTENPREALGYEPINQLNTQQYHATMVVDIAAGNLGQKDLSGQNMPGIATGPDLIFVDVASVKVPEGNSKALDANFGDAAQIVEALAFIFDQAHNTPCVVNISLGTLGGPHDGSAHIEEAIDRLVRAQPNRAVVLAAGNFGGPQSGAHVRGKASDDPANPTQLKVEVQNSDQSGNEIEVWYSGEDQFTLEVTPPGCSSSVASVPVNHSAEIKDHSDKCVMFIANRLHDPNNKKNLINVILTSAAAPGEWSFVLRPVEFVNGEFDAWLEHDEFSPAVFDNGDGQYTLSSIACGKYSIVVGAYEVNSDPPLRAVLTTSSGPTVARDGSGEVNKPEVSAPGTITIIPAFFSSVGAKSVGTQVASGTSISAAVVSGAIALLFSKAWKLGIKLSIQETREFLIKSCGARPISKDGEWDNQLGYGHLSIPSLLSQIAVNVTAVSTTTGS